MFILPLTPDPCNIFTPYIFCLANYKCGYIRKFKQKDFKDYLPRYFDNGSNNMCVYKADFPNGLNSFPKEYE